MTTTTTTYAATEIPPQLMEVSRRLLDEGLAVAEKAFDWLHDVDSFAQAVGLLASHSEGYSPESDDASTYWSDTLHVGLLLQLAVWLGDQQEKLTGSVGGPSYSVMDLRELVKAATGQSGSRPAGESMLSKLSGLENEVSDLAELVSDLAESIKLKMVAS